MTIGRESLDYLLEYLFFDKANRKLEEDLIYSRCLRLASETEQGAAESLLAIVPGESATKSMKIIYDYVAKIIDDPTTTDDKLRYDLISSLTLDGGLRDKEGSISHSDQDTLARSAAHYLRVLARSASKAG